METEKRNVLEVEFQKVFDNKFAWRITKWELKFNDLEAIDIARFSIPFNADVYGVVVQGTGGNRYFIYEDKLINYNEKKEIEKIVDKMNEKYGKKVRWRATTGEPYYTFSGSGRIYQNKDYYSLIDTNLYELGNYFKTEEEAKIGLSKIKKALLIEVK